MVFTLIALTDVDIILEVERDRRGRPQIASADTIFEGREEEEEEEEEGEEEEEEEEEEEDGDLLPCLFFASTPVSTSIADKCPNRSCVLKEIFFSKPESLLLFQEEVILGWRKKFLLVRTICLDISLQLR